MAILFKEDPLGTRLSVRTRPGGVDATVLTGAFGGGGHARAAGATIELARERRADAGPGRSRAAGRRHPALTMARGPRGGGLDGILVVSKPTGPTSHDVVALVRRLAATRRVGHGGTLDPFASGVLPVFLGHATRVVEYHLAIGRRTARPCASGPRRRPMTSKANSRWRPDQRPTGPVSKGR